jgi:hypothetical protein
MRVIRSVRDTHGNVIRKQPPGGTGQQRCMKCQNMCLPKRLPNGKVVMRCSGCGASYVNTALDTKPVPQLPRPGASTRRVRL